MTFVTIFLFHCCNLIAATVQRKKPAVCNVSKLKSVRARIRYISLCFGEKEIHPFNKQREAAAPDGLQCEILLIEGRPVFFLSPVTFFVEMKP